MQMHVQTALAAVLCMGQDVTNNARFPMFARRLDSLVAATERTSWGPL
jgi:hypothetical protein